jgi:hypothetical protein
MVYGLFLVLLNYICISSIGTQQLVSEHFPWPKKGRFGFSFCKIFSREEKEGVTLKVQI